MLADYIVFASVCAIVLSYLGIIHHFWLRDGFEEKTPLDVHAKNGLQSEMARTRLGLNPSEKTDLVQHLKSL